MANCKYQVPRGSDMPVNTSSQLRAQDMKVSGLFQGAGEPGSRVCLSNIDTPAFMEVAVWASFSS